MGAALRAPRGLAARRGARAGADPDRRRRRAARPGRDRRLGLGPRRSNPGWSTTSFSTATPPGRRSGTSSRSSSARHGRMPRARAWRWRGWRSTSATARPPTRSMPGRGRSGHGQVVADEGRRPASIARRRSMGRPSSRRRKPGAKSGAVCGSGRSPVRCSSRRPTAFCGLPRRPMRSWRRAAPGPAGFVHIPKGTTAEWMKQLTAEQLMTVRTRQGFQKLEWQQTARAQRGARLPGLCPGGRLADRASTAGTSGAGQQLEEQIDIGRKDAPPAGLPNRPTDATGAEAPVRAGWGAAKESGSEWPGHETELDGAAPRLRQRHAARELRRQDRGIRQRRRSAEPHPHDRGADWRPSAGKPRPVAGFAGFRRS